MIDLTPELLTVILVGGVLLMVLIGVPIGIAVGGVAFFVGYLLFGPLIGDLIYMRVYGMMTSYILIAIPMFIFMGIMTERSGVAEKLYDALHEWFGGFRGGLAMVTILVGTLMAAAVGIIAASITMLTFIALPAMIKRGYKKSFASGAVAAGGTLGILIPPSIMLVLYAPMAGLSIGRLFFGAIGPGLVLATLYVGYVVIRSWLQPQIAPPAQQKKTSSSSFVKKTWELIVAVVPFLVLMMSVLGVIFMGIAPPTEAAGIGAFVATLLAIFYGKFSFRVLKETALITMKMCGFIFFLITMAVVFSSVFIAAGAAVLVEEFILGIGGGKWLTFAIIMLIIFVMGKIIDWMGIVFIIVPIITPIGAALGFDPIWFAIMVCLNLQMSFLTPPVASAIFICQGACDPKLNVTSGDIISGVLPYVAMVVVALILCTIFPQIVLWLPNMMI